MNFQKGDIVYPRDNHKMLGVVVTPNKNPGVFGDYLEVYWIKKDIAESMPSSLFVKYQDLIEHHERKFISHKQKLSDAIALAKSKGII